jgi:hypothetical protein
MDILRKYQDTAFEEIVTRIVLQHRNIRDEKRISLLGDESARYEAVEFMNDPSYLDRFISVNMSDSMVDAIIANHNTTAEQLDKIAASTAGKLDELKKLPNLKSHMYYMLANSLSGISCHHNVSERTLRVLSKTKDTDVRSAVAKCTKSLSLLQSMENGETNTDVLLAMVRNHVMIDETILERVFNMFHMNFQPKSVNNEKYYGAIDHWNRSERNIALAVAGNPFTPLHMLKGLCFYGVTTEPDWLRMGSYDLRDIWHEYVSIRKRAKKTLCAHGFEAKEYY